VIGAAEAVQRIGIPMPAIVIESWTGKQLAEFGGLPGLPDPSFAWRGELHTALHDEAARAASTPSSASAWRPLTMPQRR
jgi:hypothetical protein